MDDSSLPPAPRKESSGGLDALPPELESELYALLDQPAELHDAALREACARHPQHASALRAAYARAMQCLEDVGDDPSAAEQERDEVRATPAEELLQRLHAAPCLDLARYQIENHELGRGGMGRVVRVEDRYLRRHLAMKAMLRRPLGDVEERRLQRQKVGRFLEEAQVTSQLDHPGVPAVHDIGLDPDGEVYFTMRLVRGDTADHVFALARAGEDGWTRTRALEVLLKVCDTMAFAHDKGVLHRDLKPRNVMVGRFGEVYVMDWGLAKILDQADTHDLRIRPMGAEAAKVQSVRGETDPESDSSLLTFDGQRLGTPYYMPPEQARGETLDRRSDVYAVGAMLYELLTGHAPFGDGPARRAAHEILEQVLAGPPRPVHALASDVPPELAAICERAMARDRAARYQGMPALASDLRAYLDQRTVLAYRTGPIAELRMWMRRNRMLATALAAVVVALLGGVTVATTQASIARERKREFDMLSNVVAYEQVIAKVDTLWPPWPEKADAMQSWLADDCGRLLDARPGIEATLAALRARGVPGPAPAAAGGLRSRELDLALAERSQRFLYQTLTDLLVELDTLAQGERVRVQRRLDWARQVDELTRRHPEAPATWEQARAAIAAADGKVASELYREHPIDLRPQMGLVPLGMNPQSKLWEFYDLRSAADASHVPRLHADGRLDVSNGTGIVFVLIPGGRAELGSELKQDERPPTVVDVPPFLLGRYEMTRGQWQRLVGHDPSFMNIGAELRGATYDASYPVNGVSWNDCARALRWEGMRLPSEDEWEYACRAHTRTAWYTGDTPASLAGHANVADVTAGDSFRGMQHEPSLTDGWAQDAPVGSFAPNPFGLYDMHGNVLEWCADVYLANRFAADRPRDAAAPGNRVARGGSWWHKPDHYARSAYRHASNPSFSEKYQGVRAARDVR